MSSKFKPEYLPQVVGNEEEARPHIERIGQRHQFKPVDGLKVVGAILGTMGRQTGLYQQGFAGNGSRYYSDNYNPEYATPECRDPEQLAIFGRANEELYCDAIESTTKDIAKRTGETVAIRNHRRNIDSKGNTWASHDSLSLGNAFAARLDDALDDNYPKGDLMRAILAHCAARSFIVGAGLVGRDTERLYFSQKRSVQHLEQMVRQFKPSIMTLRGLSVDGPKKREHRLEIRDGDCNFSDWATQVRVAGTAGMLVLLQMGLVSKLGLEQMADYIWPGKENPINHLLLHPDGTIEHSHAVMTAVDFERRATDMMRDKCQDKTYHSLFEEQYRYCEDFLKVMRGQATIELLADRADWAAKFYTILRSIEYDAKQGITERSLYDLKSQGTDVMYDVFRVTATPDGEVTKHHGIGHKLRERGRFLLSVARDEIESAKTTPPLDTRAWDRVERMRTGTTTEKVGWHYVKNKGEPMVKMTHLRRQVA